VYGGGGSPSSDEPSFFGSVRDAFVSATAEDGAGSSDSSTGAGGAKAGGQAGPGSVTLYGRLVSGSDGKIRDENGGGYAGEELDADAGECGGGAV
jgi:hypothetical protein